MEGSQPFRDWERGVCVTVSLLYEGGQMFEKKNV